MTFPQDTIKLGAAKRIFEGYSIQEIKIDDDVVGYSATVDGQVIQRKGLTDLCTSVATLIRSSLALSTVKELFPDFKITGQMVHGRLIGYIATRGVTIDEELSETELVEAPDLLGLCHQLVAKLGEKSPT